QLEATNGFEALDAVQLPEARRPCLLRTRHRNPIVILVIGGDEPLDVQPPYLLVTRVEPELRERNPHFGGPSMLLDARPRLPDRIDCRVEILSVGCVIAIEPDARCSHAKSVRRPVIKIRIECD